MKIIFDSEKQKKAFFNTIVADHCPGIFGFTINEEFFCDHMVDCDVCWENCGIEMEVKDE